MKITLLDRIKAFFKPYKPPQFYQPTGSVRKSNVPSRDWLYDTNYLPNPNLFVTNYGVYINQLVDYYRICNEDTQIKSSIEQLIFKITALDDSDHLEQNPIPGKKALSKRIYIYADRQYLNLNIDRIKREGLDSAFKTGLAIFQKVYKNNGRVDPNTGYLEIQSLRLRNADFFYFKYNEKGDLELYYRPDGNMRGKNKEGQLCDWNNFIVLWNNGSDIQPYGESEIGRIGVGWYYIGKATVNYWNRTMERKGDPTLTVKQEEVEGAAKTEKGDIDDIVDDMYENQGVGGVIALPTDVNMEYLEANMNQSFDYQEIYDIYKNGVRQLILNAASTMENTSSTGSYNQSSVHESSLISKVDSKALMFENFINRLIEELVNLNFPELTGNNVYYPLYDIILGKENEEAQLKERQIEQNKDRIFDLIAVAGSEVDKKTVFEWFGLPTDKLEANETFETSNDNVVTEENVIINEFKKAYNNGRNFSKVLSLLDNIKNKGKEVLLND